MPTTISSTTGRTYHVWQLPQLTTPEPTESIQYVELENDLSDGFYSQRLLGSNLGLRSWKLKAPTLAATSIGMPTVTDVYGSTSSRLNYVLSLFKYSKVTGNPFAFRSPVDGQYYLTRFADTSLSLQMAKVALYAGELALKEVRISGETIFDPTAMNGYASMHWYNETSHNSGAGRWDDKNVAIAQNLTKTGDVVFNANPQNGKNTVRLGTTTVNGGLSATWFDFYDAVIVMQADETPFASRRAILTNDTPAATFETLAGPSGATMLSTGTSTSGLVYVSVNGTPVIDTSTTLVGTIAGPMNTYKIYHWSGIGSKYDDGNPSANVALGLGYQPVANINFLKGRFAEVGLWITPQPREDINAFIQYLVAKWAIT